MTGSSAAGAASTTSSPLEGDAHTVGSGDDSLARHTHYTADYIEPAIPEFVAMGYDEARLRRGLLHLLSIHDDPHGAFTQLVYRARGRA